MIEWVNQSLNNFGFSKIFIFNSPHLIRLVKKKRVTKVKAAKGEKSPRPRIISVSSQFLKRVKSHIKIRQLKADDNLALLSAPAAHIAMKKTLQRIGIKDWQMFSLHNVRKTHGNYLKALGIDGAEICTRLGHDYQTFLKSYSSPNIFSFKDIQDMKQILGDLYQKNLMR